MKNLILGFSLFLFTFSVFGQAQSQIDGIVNQIYNFDFVNVPDQLTQLEKTDPKIAGYLKFDFLWWKMISNFSVSTESEFNEYKKSFLDNTDDINRDFKKLIYYLYQIRYSNFKNTSFSKYLAAIKCHVYLLKIDKEKASALKPLERNIFQLIVEFDKCLKYKFISELDLLTNKNRRQFQISLEKIGTLQSSQFASFKTIKDYFLGKIYLDIENDSFKAYEIFSNLSERYPGNKIFKSIKNDCEFVPKPY